MSEQTPDEDSTRLVACRACGNRIARTVRRCPACGAREPTSPVEPAAPVERVEAAASGRRWGSFAALAGAALLGAAVSAGVFVLRPSAPPPASERRTEPAPAVPAPAPAPATPAPAPEPSRSRGRADWLFFFKTGDQLARMSDDTPLGMVLRTVPRYEFADGTTGPAYLLQLPDGGGQRFVDADELERGGRLQ